MNSGDTLKQKRERLVIYLKDQGHIRTPAVERAFLQVKRELFVPIHLRNAAYHDRPLPIGKGQTISAPHMVAIMAEELDLNEGFSVLEIGAGSGYHAAIVSRLVGSSGKITSLERISKLAGNSRKSLKASKIENVEVLTLDGSNGYPENGPYDRIYFTCAASELSPEIFDQVKENGMVLSVEGEPYSTQRLIRYLKDGNGKWKAETLTFCVFVPLLSGVDG
jgi:protein-L-isoaspartate(D-aspartate) O-methyltransferase